MDQTGEISGTKLQLVSPFPCILVIYSWILLIHVLIIVVCQGKLIKLGT